MRTCIPVRFLVLLGSVLTVLISGCSDKGVNTDVSVTSVDMSFKVASPGMIDLVDQFRVIVTAADMDPIEAPLVLTGRYLEGVVLVPPGDDRTFTVEASDVEGAVLYRGDTTVTVGAVEIAELSINLYPVVSLVRVSPRYMEVPANSDFAVDVRVFNVRELYGITFRLHWQGNVIYPDSARSLLPLGTDAIYWDRIEPTQQFFEISVSNSDQLTPMVDSIGDVDLVRVFFSAFSPEPLAFQASLLMEVMEMTKLPDGNIPLDSVKVDGSTVVVEFPVF